MESSNNGKDTAVPSRPVVGISLSVSQTLGRCCSLSIETPAANRLGFIVPAHHHRRQPHRHRPHRHRPHRRRPHLRRPPHPPPRTPPHPRRPNPPRPPAPAPPPPP